MMNLDDWISALFARVQPATGSPERAVLYLRPRLEDLSPYWFTEDAIAGIWMHLRSLNSAERVRKALREFHALRAPPRPPPISQQEREASEWEDRKAWLRRDWDNPARIMQNVRATAGHPMQLYLLRLQAKMVRLWAPQHLGYLPPHILEAIERDDSPAPLSRQDQLNALGQVAVTQPRHLTPEQLDRINPLPNGRKRTDATAHDAASTAAAHDRMDETTADEDTTAAD
jgi:hypothetical protein